MLLGDIFPKIDIEIKEKNYKFSVLEECCILVIKIIFLMKLIKTPKVISEKNAEF